MGTSILNLTINLERSISNAFIHKTMSLKKMAMMFGFERTSINLLQYWYVAVILGITIVVVGAWIVSRKSKGLMLSVQNVIDNEDDSYTVHFGYTNPTNTSIHYSEGNFGVRAVTGTYLILKNNISEEFLPGSYKSAVIVVISSDSEIEFYVGHKKVRVSGQALKGSGLLQYQTNH